MYKDVIGVVGGMGSYATLSFFERLLKAFPASREWDRPRIIIDNRCTMPSRVRAILYGENVDLLECQLIDSVSNLLHSGATRIILTCNTSHYFLPAIYNALPEAKGKIINIIDKTVNEVVGLNVDEVTLLASEGTISTGLFHKAFSNNGIMTYVPNEEQFGMQRELIETVKQDLINDDALELFQSLISSAKTKCVILGCTEFPVLYGKISDIPNKIIVDPLDCTISYLKKHIM